VARARSAISRGGPLLEPASRLGPSRRLRNRPLLTDQVYADSLWRYREDLVTAARKQDGPAALSVSDASLDNATQRIRALLAAQKTDASANAF
jgi:hypothetical protein